MDITPKSISDVDEYCKTNGGWFLKAKILGFLLVIENSTMWVFHKSEVV